MRPALPVIAALAVSLPFAAEAGLRVCNDIDSVMRVAIGYQQDGVWTSEGWWTVDAGACAMVIGKSLDKLFYYWRAEPDTGTFPTGDYDFCTGPSPFTIPGDTDCAARGFVTQRFHQIELVAGTQRHTLALGPADLDPTETAPTPAPRPDPQAADTRRAPGGWAASATSITDANAAPPGTHGEPYSVSGLLSHCEVTDAGQQCQVHANGWRYLADLTGPTSVDVIEWLAALPEASPIAIQGDMKSYGGTLAEVTIRHAELAGPDPFAAQRKALQGLWTSLDDSSYQLLIFGAVAEELSGGMYVGTSMLDMARACDGSQGDGPYVTLTSYDAMDEPRCMSLDRLSATELEMWPLGVMRPLRFTRTN